MEAPPKDEQMTPGLSACEMPISVDSHDDATLKAKMLKRLDSDAVLFQGTLFSGCVKAC